MSSYFLPVKMSIPTRWTFNWNEYMWAQQNLHWEVTVSQGRNPLGNKCQKHTMVTDHPLCTGWANSCSNISQQQIASYELENFCEDLCLFVATQVAKNKLRLNLSDLLQWQNSVAATKSFTKIHQYTQSDLLPWCVALTCGCKLLPCVYCPLKWLCHKDIAVSGQFCDEPTS